MSSKSRARQAASQKTSVPREAGRPCGLGTTISSAGCSSLLACAFALAFACGSKPGLAAALPAALPWRPQRQCVLHLMAQSGISSGPQGARRPCIIKIRFATKGRLARRPGVRMTYLVEPCAPPLSAPRASLVEGAWLARAAPRAPALGACVQVAFALAPFARHGGKALTEQEHLSKCGYGLNVFVRSLA